MKYHKRKANELKHRPVQAAKCYHELHVADDLFTPIDNYLHQSWDSGCDDPHQNLVVIHGPVFIGRRRHLSSGKRFDFTQD